MVARYAPLVLPQPLHDMPDGYQKIVPLFDGLSQYSAQQHVTKMNEFCEIYEIDEADVQCDYFPKV